MAPTTTSAVSARSITELLVSHIQGRQNLKPILQNIYILISWYLGYGVSQDNYGSSVMESGLNFKLEDTIFLSSILLNELHKKLSLASNDTSLDQDVGLALSDDNIWDPPDEIILLLRCCCLVVWLHPHDQTVALKFQDVVALLRRLYSHLIYSQSDKSTDSSVRLVKRMLEVYVDEVFAAERHFQECLVIPKSVSSTYENQSICSFMQIKTVLEVIAAHFLLSVPGDYALQNFLKSLIWTEKRMQSHPELCLTAGLSLIEHPVVMSAPAIVHSYLISLVSEVIGSCFFPHKAGLNVNRSKLYVSAFYDAAILYSRHFTKLMTSSRSQQCTPGKNAHRALQSLFHFEIFDKVNLLLVDLNHAWRAQFGETSILITDAISYIKMNIHIIAEADRNNVFTFMSSVISNVSSTEINELLLERIRAMTLQDICLLASILKLMSCSLLQATRYSTIGLSCLELLSESKHMPLGNSPLSGIMSCFAQYNLLPMKVQQLIVEGLKPGLPSHDEFKLMFVHFAGLLSLCMISGLEILVKGCLFFMLVFLNTLNRKEGGSDFQKPLVNESPAHAISQAKSTSTATESIPNNTSGRTQMKISSIRTASKFQRARHLMLRHQTSLDCSNTSDEETCNGEAFLKYFTDNPKDIAELADFIECKQGKDYIPLLVNRGKYRYKKLRKFAKQRRTRVLKACRSLGYESHVKL